MLKKELVNWLDTFNNTTVPNLIAKGFKPTPINAREGLANLTKGFISNIPEVSIILDDYIYNDDYNVPVRIYGPHSQCCLWVSSPDQKPKAAAISLEKKKSVKAPWDDSFHSLALFFLFFYHLSNFFDANEFVI